MKKIMIIALICLILVGCKPKESKEYKVYTEYINKINEKDITNIEEYPCNIDINIEKITNDEIQYSLKIDDFKENLYDIETIILHEEQTQDIFPSIGIFDDKLSLPADKQKGLLLVGYIDFDKEIKEFHTTFKVYIKCKDIDNNQREYFFIKQI